MDNVNRKFSAYDFLCMFSALCFIKGINFFDKESLELFIDLNKCALGRYESLLVDNKNIDKAYSMLKFAKVLDEENSVFYIKEDIPIRDIITLRPNYYCEMENFVSDFIEFTRKNGEKKEESAESEATKGLKFVK